LGGSAFRGQKLFTLLIKANNAKLLKGLAPQAGFEPATLRLTGGKRSVSRRLRLVAFLCRSAHLTLVKSSDFSLSLRVAFCGRLLAFVASKGQEKDNVRY